MKKIYIYTILTVLLFSNCEKVVDIDVPSIEPKLIIDASFEVLFNESPVKANVAVKLKLSTDYFDETIPTVSDAIVYLTNTADSSVINFSDVNLNGNFTPIINFIPKDAI